MWHMPIRRTASSSWSSPSRERRADTIDLKMLEDSVHLSALARDIEYVASLALGWAVKPDKAEATYEHGLLRIEVPFKDPMEDAVKVVIKAGGAEARAKKIEGK